MMRYVLLYLCISFFSFNLLMSSEEDLFLSTHPQFVSEVDAVEEEDGYGHRLVHTYTPADFWTDSKGKFLISTIQEFEMTEEGERLASVERFIWESSESHKPLLCVRSLQDAEGSAYFATQYVYDTIGRPIQKISYGNLSGTSSVPLCLQSNGYPEDNGVETLQTFYVYDREEQGSLLLNELDDQGSITSYFYDGNDQMMGTTLYEEEREAVEKGAITSLLDSANGLYSMIASYLWAFKEMEERLDHTVNETLGGFFLTMSGWHFFEPRAGVYGKGELNEKVRITMINGILNRPETCEEGLEIISGAHQETNLHYIFRPTDGFTWDLMKSFFVKMGYVSRSARLLAQVWKDLIEDMGGIDGGGIVIHYAHSVGGTETYAASSLLSPEERKMIRVVTIGSASMLPSTLGFESVVNYVSLRDLVPLLDPEGYLKGLLYADSNVIYLGGLLGIPMIDHLMTMDTYRELIENLGKKFLEEHKKQAA